ncbi:hypothetical protein B0H19DRAFT_1260343 [Mycena capillaripes]|nr:hypothetical protein B0H19DRAFT_1260343 [Mycena capillaripes]
MPCPGSGFAYCVGDAKLENDRVGDVSKPVFRSVAFGGASQQGLSLVCRLFRSVVLPALLQYRTIDAIAKGLSHENWIDRLRHLHRTAVRLDNLKEERYTLLVGSWRLSIAKGGAAWPSLPGVQNIQLFDHLPVPDPHVTGDFSLSETFTLLSRLDDIDFHSCKILTSPGFLPLRRLGLHECDLRSAYLESLCTLIAGSHISRLIPGSSPRSLNQLVDVWLSHFTVQKVDLFFGFFEQCPRLESLTIYTRENHIRLPGVRPNCIPRLRSLAAPPIFHQSLALDHPVRCAEILRNNGVAEEEDYERLMRVCCDIGRSSVPVLILILLAPCSAAPNLDSLVGVVDLFLELKSFSLMVQPRFCGRIYQTRRRGTPRMWHTRVQIQRMYCIWFKCGTCLNRSTADIRINQSSSKNRPKYFAPFLSSTIITPPLPTLIPVLYAPKRVAMAPNRIPLSMGAMMEFKARYVFSPRALGPFDALSLSRYIYQPGFVV